MFGFGKSKPSKMKDGAEASGDKIRVEQSDWTVVGKSLIKSWGVSGADTNYEVRIDISKTKSRIHGGLEPIILIFVDPHPLSGGEGFLTLLFGIASNLSKSPFTSAETITATDGSCIIRPTDLNGTLQIFQVLTSNEAFVISLIVKNGTLAFRTLLPNHTNKMSDLWRSLPLYF